MARIALGLLFILAAACGDEGDDRVRLYHTEPVAPGLDQADVEGLNVLGSTIVPTGVNFSVYSENAHRMDLLLFDDPEADRPTRRFTMHRFGDVWNLYVEGIGRGQQGKGGVGRLDGMPLRIPILKNRHKTIAGGLIDITADLVDAV